MSQPGSGTRSSTTRDQQREQDVAGLDRQQDLAALDVVAEARAAHGLVRVLARLVGRRVPVLSGFAGRRGSVGEHQDPVEARHAGRRRAGDAGEGEGRVALDVGHRRHGQSGRIGAVDAGGHQHVAGLDVGIHRNEPQFQRAVVPEAEGDRAQAAAGVLHRHRLGLVRDQRHLGHEREHARDLADHAHVVDHGLALRARHGWSRGR